MYEGIKLLNSGKTIDLNSLSKNENGQLILEGIDSLKVILEDGASFDKKVQVLENDNDVLITLIDSSGEKVELVLLSLSEMLLKNNTDVPVFEAFVGVDSVASFTTVDDLEAAAAGGDEGANSTSISQTSDFGDQLGGSSQDGIGQSGENLDGFTRTSSLDTTDPTYGRSISFSGDLESEITEDFGQDEEGILSGKITNNDPNYGTLPFIAQTTETEYGIFTIDEEGNWTYELFGDNVQFLQEPNKLLETFEVQLLGNDTTVNVDVNIAGVNDAPVFEPIADQETAEDGILIVPIDVSDIDGDELTFEAIATDGSVEVSVDEETGNTNVTYLPNPNFNGEVTITIKVSDGHGEEVTQTFNVNVQGVNDIPEVATVNLDYLESELLPEESNSTLSVGSESEENLNNYATDLDNELSFSRNGKSLILVIENNEPEVIEALEDFDLGYIQAKLVDLVTRTGISEAFDSIADRKSVV